MIDFIKKLFSKEIYEEAALAYWYKLPDEIKVEWFRDGRYIVGKITFPGNNFMTQALSAEEFIKMVNDAVFAVYDIPKEYFKILDNRKFKPSPEQFAKLKNASILSSQINLEKALATA